MSPTENIVNNIKSGNAKTVFTYYTSCQGLNPFYYDISNATYYNNLINMTITGLTIGSTAPCPGDATLMAAFQDTSDIQVYINSLNETTQCEPLYDTYDQAINQGVCTDGFTGM
jgi:hypothetical protein